MKCNLICISMLLFCCMSHQRGALGNNDEDNWIEPDAWAREQYWRAEEAHALDDRRYTSNLKSSVAKGDVAAERTHSDEALALAYFKKFIAHLFNTNVLKYDETTAEYHRALLFTVLPMQLEKLKELNDPRDLDCVLTEILLRARTPQKYDLDGSGGFGKRMGVIALIWDILKDLVQLLKTTEIHFMLGAAFLILLGWYCHRRYGIGIVTMIIGAVATFGYFHTYLECNRKLEAERLLEIMTQNEQAPSSWYSSIAKLFSSHEPQKKSEQDYIRKSSQLNLPFCRPDHVFMLYANDLFLKQLEFLLDKCITTIERFRATLSFPYNYIAILLLGFLIWCILELTFKYILSPRAWIGLYQSRATREQHGALPATGTAQHDDRVSGENLRMLLNVISGASRNVETSAKATDAAVTSGVQQILEPLESGDAADNSGATNETCTDGTPSKCSTPDTSVNKEQRTQNNNNENDAQIRVVDKSKVSPQDEAETKAA